VSGASLSSREPLAVIFGCAGPELSAAERAFFRDADPLGFILFQRNCRDPDQVRALVAALRDAVGRGDAPVLIDQEGGRVARLKPPHWPAYPAPAAIAALDGDKALEAARAAARLIADDLSRLGITVDCVPVLDMPVPGADAVIGDRAWGRSPAPVAALGRAVCEGMLAGGALPVVKDSRETLEASDFAPFRALRDMPWGMTAHIVYAAIDAERAGTLSPSVIAQAIRGAIGFDGVLITDDLSMRALGGSFASRSAGALAAGCDLALHCNGDMTEMKEVAAAVAPLSAGSRARVDRAEDRRQAREPIDRGALEARFRALLAGEA
jgi:beta-N-acetylhexosaminidase